MQNYFTISDFEVFPLFSSPVSIVKLNEDFSDFFEKIKNEKYVSLSTKNIERKNNYISESTHILDQRLKEKQIFLKCFTNYKNNVLKLHNTEFDITTSWLTKTDCGGSSQMHKHANSAFSAIFYFQDIVNSGEIAFYNHGIKPSSYEFNEFSDLNILNFNEFVLRPAKNLMVIFPSYLFHRVEIYHEKESRYSLAMNFIPIGKYGTSDGRVNIVNKQNGNVA